MHFTGDDGIGVVGDERVVETQLDGHSQAVAALAKQARFKSDFPSFHDGRVAQRSYVCRGNAFHPHRLPDACGSRIPDGVRLELPILLAARFGEVSRIVIGADAKVLRAFRSQEVSYVGGKRRVSALVLGGHSAVDPYGGAVIDGPEVNN